MVTSCHKNELFKSSLLLLLTVWFVEATSLIVPGDMIRISSYEDSTLTGVYTVNEQGAIALPIGTPLTVEGPVSSLDTRVKSYLQSFYRKTENITIEVVHKGIAVRISGFVHNPGLYALAPESELQDLIRKAGGLKDGAVIDRFIVSNRYSKKQRIYDYKKFLETGSRETQLKLFNGDVIFVPMSPTVGNVQRTLMAHLPQPDESRRNVVNVLGEVAKPGAYEINTTVTVLDMIAMAGGPMIPRNTSMIPDLENIKIIHSDGSSVKVELFNMNRYFDTGDESLLVSISAGDNILLPAKKVNVEDKSKVVSVLGAVAKPSTYEISGSIYLEQIIARAGGLLKEKGVIFGDMKNITLIRPDSLGIAYRTIDLEQLLTLGNGTTQVQLYPNDIVFVAKKKPSDIIDEEEKRFASVIGEVNRPGRYAVGSRDDLVTMLARAGGPVLKSARDEVTLIRFVDGKKRRFQFDLEEFHSSDELEFDEALCVDGIPCTPGLPIIQPGDILVVDRKPEIRVDFIAKMVYAIGSAALVSISLSQAIRER